MSDLIILWVFVMTMFALIHYHWSRRKLYTFASQVSGPWALPVLGNGLKFLCKKEEILNAFLGVIDQYPSPMRLWMGPKLILVVKDPRQLQTILQSPKITTKAFIYKFLEPFMGNGLFTSSGSYHKRHRKMLQPMFSQKLIDGYSHLFQKHALKLVEQIRKHSNGPEFDISYYLQESAFESSMDLLLEDKNDHFIDYKDIPQFVRRFYDIVFTRIRNVWFYSEFIFKKSSLFKQQQEMKEMATVFINEIMETRVPEIVKRLQNNEVCKDVEDVRTPSMLEMFTQMIMDDPNCLTVNECIDHLMTLTATSQDTQSSAVAFTMMMLGAYPDIQNAAYQELKEVLGERKTLDLTDVSKLKYLDMCLKESMRLYPVGPFIFRHTTEEFSLEKWKIPENVTVTLSIFHAHRDPNSWEKPYEYYPDHFLPDAVAKRHPYAFIPFSAGPRKCIAQQYSYVNMEILLGTLLLNFEVECRFKVEDIKLYTDISIRPFEGYMIKIKPRA